MATLSEERTDVVGRSSTYAVGAAAADSGLVLDVLLLHLPYKPVYAPWWSSWSRSSSALECGPPVRSRSVAADCFLISGTEYGGVTVVPGCGEASAASVQAVALPSQSSTVTVVTGSSSVVSPRLWVPIPRIVVDLVGGLLG